MDGYGGSRATRSSGPGGDRSVARSRLLRWLVAVAVSAVAAGSLPAVGSASTAGGAPEASGQSGLPHGLGLVVTPSAAPSAAAVARVNTAAASLPASVDLTANAMPPGNQGEVGSCAAWASDYTALGYWENYQGISGGGLEPMYTYSQVTGGVDRGSTIESNLTVDEQQGVDNQADYSQGNFDYVDMPTAAERAHAVNWKLTSFNDLPIQTSSTSTLTQQSIEGALAAGTPVVIGIPVFLNFEYITSANHGLYTGPSGEFLGYHAITALGYNSTGLRIENSWGTYWGDSGYATLSWSFVNGYVDDAVAVGSLVIAQPPANTSPPTVTGTARQGQTLTASSGSWSPAATSYAYQWQRAASASSSWSAISGATGATYVPAAADVGGRLRVLVTAANSHGSGTATSTPIGPIASGAPSSTAAPSVSGTLREGQAMTASTGSWSPAATSYAYQWQRAANGGSTWSVIPGATTTSYVSAAADAGGRLRVLVTATNSYGQATTTSAAVGPISGAPYNTAAPSVTGTLRQGQTVTASAGSWSPTGTSYTYQWQRSTNGGTTWASVSSKTGAS